MYTQKSGHCHIAGMGAGCMCEVLMRTSSDQHLGMLHKIHAAAEFHNELAHCHILLFQVGLQVICSFARLQHPDFQF